LTIYKLSQQAASVVCGLPYSFYEEHKNAAFSTLTPPDMLPRRCLDLCYVTVLLKQFGFREDDRRIYFVDRIIGNPISWSVGAYLVLESTERVESDRIISNFLASKVAEGIPLGWNISIMLLVFAIIALFTSVKRASESGTTCAIEFIDDASE